MPTIVAKRLRALNLETSGTVYTVIPAVVATEVTRMTAYHPTSTTGKVDLYHIPSSIIVIGTTPSADDLYWVDQLDVGTPWESPAIGSGPVLDPGDQLIAVGNTANISLNIYGITADVAG